MNVIEKLQNGIFSKRPYSWIAPAFPLGVAWIIDFGFLLSPARIETNPAFFLPLALVMQTALCVGVVYAVYFVLDWLLDEIKAANINPDDGWRWAIFCTGGIALLLFITLAGCTLIMLALLGTTVSAAQLLEVMSKTAGTFPALSTVARLNVLWYVAAFLAGLELLKLFKPKVDAKPAAP
jgi:hypothetical protein